MDIRIGEKAYKAEFNGFTPIAFSRAFKEVAENGRKRPRDIAEAVSRIADSITTYGVPAVTPLLEILYACIKTAEPTFSKTFDEWVSALPSSAFNLERKDGWATDVMRIVEDNFFPSAKDGVEAEAAEKAAAEAPE
ncbi:hypothetical protein [Collinsella stercoris]|uniref:Uncharacterized protein n=1 Tax=Collinsella stercoris DSM 13279 TaxID=445975 RepID=B6GDH6_9ACTN|nr:hypothetical protein [Collinsella stercoris]EEA89615.1 hypothetical protein COLSTE_02156 [Collinsella stercoris DSM 13279]UEA45205.1 hypothetical protein LK434_08740 [Collinsella stercoris DSM 13279]UWP12270.1 hypothetical protein NQ498_03290 [Collinsella stercoris]